MYASHISCRKWRCSFIHDLFYSFSCFFLFFQLLYCCNFLLCSSRLCICSSHFHHSCIDNSQKKWDFCLEKIRFLLEFDKVHVFISKISFVVLIKNWQILLQSCDIKTDNLVLEYKPQLWRHLREYLYVLRISHFGDTIRKITSEVTCLEPSQFSENFVTWDSVSGTKSDYFDLWPLELAKSSLQTFVFRSKAP